MAEQHSVTSELRQAAASLAGVSREPQRDATLLMRAALGKDRAWILAHGDASLTQEQLTAFQTLLARRRQHEPIQYILGEQEFYGLRLVVAPAVLIPRPETEHLVEAVLARIPRDTPVRIADVGTGSGAIAVALAHALPLAEVDALDISHEALAVAERNAAVHGLEVRVHCRHSNLLDEVAGQRFDAIVSNPPYIAEGEVLEPQVVDWEPHQALFAGPHGLDIYTQLIPQAAMVLKPGGLLALEIGYGQQAEIAGLLLSDGRWGKAAFVEDLQGIARVALVCRAAYGRMAER
jgi:release factor glutamine methyltransferase